MDKPSIFQTERSSEERTKVRWMFPLGCDERTNGLNHLILARNSLTICSRCSIIATSLLHFGIPGQETRVSFAATSHPIAKVAFLDERDFADPRSHSQERRCGKGTLGEILGGPRLARRCPAAAVTQTSPPKAFALINRSYRYILVGRRACEFQPLKLQVGFLQLLGQVSALVIIVHFPVLVHQGLQLLDILFPTNP